MTSTLEAHFTAAAGLEYLLHLLQKWSKTPWITEHTAGINVAARAIMSLGATIGITLHYSSSAHELVIGGLSLVGIATGLWHWFSQFAGQHAFGRIIRGLDSDAVKKVVLELLDAKFKRGDVIP